MDCKWVHSRLIDYAKNNLQNKDKDIIKEHIKSCDSCGKEIQQIETTLTDYNSLTNKLPSFEFKEMMKTKLQDEIDKGRNINRYRLKSLRQIAAGVLLLICGALIGFFINSNISKKREILTLQNEIQNLKKNETLASLREQTTSDKLQSILYLSRQNNIDNNINTVLFTCLVSDDNPNVRLAALRVLANYKQTSSVRTMLIESLEYQTNPMVQISLIEILKDFKQDEAFNAIQSFIDNENVNDEIKKYSTNILTHSTRIN